MVDTSQQRPLPENSPEVQAKPAPTPQHPHVKRRSVPRCSVSGATCSSSSTSVVSHPEPLKAESPPTSVPSPRLPPKKNLARS